MRTGRGPGTTARATTAHRGNLRWALASAATLVVVFYCAGAAIDRVGAPLARVGYALIALTIVLAPLALVWVVGEAHLRWSPRTGLARGAVGWALALGCLGVLVLLAPPAIYVFVMCLGYAFR